MKKPDPLTVKQLRRWFPLRRRALKQENTYEFALTLGGTVSAGAYTAGVLDFLFEALDLWQRAKEDNNPAAPRHNAVLSAIAGASGGAINGAIALRTAGWVFPHGPVKGNPFYDLWVDGVGISSLLSIADGSDTGLGSVFYTKAFDTLADDLIQRTGAPLGSDKTSPKQRSYLADPLRLIATVGNVTGIPYEIRFRGETKLGHELVAHADVVRFTLTIPGGVPNIPRARPDERALSFSDKDCWRYVKDAALATSAFPIAFPPRRVDQTFYSYAYRVVAIPGNDTDPPERAQLLPCWELMDADPGAPPDGYRTVNVDGGTFNNEPLDHARIALAGLGWHNARNGGQADRGVVLVDPFTDLETRGLFELPGLLKMFGPMLSALINQGRYKPEDIALAKKYDSYSRFLVAPEGPVPGKLDAKGKAALATGGMGGFLGFFNRAFLDHDFRLGRYNAYFFLKDEFVLPETNPIFEKTWEPDHKTKYGHVEDMPTVAEIPASEPDDDLDAEDADECPDLAPAPEDAPIPAANGPIRYLPIIPMMAPLGDKPPELAKWPKLNAMPDLKAAVTSRLDILYQQLKREGQKEEKDKDGKVTKESWWPGGAIGFAIGVAWRTWARSWACNKFIKAVRKGLVDQGLLDQNAP
ncbi:patatin-like phospholipase family protein [Rhizomicrobium electricum]|uniref:PNPLA domain-containing protein n=1 Tax=Rhizomicrobium electricum TaxID=480070 RepID=A0ABN1F1T6_9PROT|nr:patatin-like phospholipase family protein [Rhizomicrobium electricum]NIJ50312.1 hypothetical protein [Rhizomicrobium electricum]